MRSIFFAVVINFNYIVKNAETDVSMTVFFNEDVDQATIDEIGTEIKAKTEALRGEGEQRDLPIADLGPYLLAARATPPQA